MNSKKTHNYIILKSLFGGYLDAFFFKQKRIIPIHDLHIYSILHISHMYIRFGNFFIIFILILIISRQLFIWCTLDSNLQTRCYGMTAYYDDHSPIWNDFFWKIVESCFLGVFSGDCEMCYWGGRSNFSYFANVFYLKKCI